LTAMSYDKKSYDEKVLKEREEIQKKTGKTPEELYKEREDRLADAIRLKEPDRVPVVLGGTFFAARYAGIPFSSAYYDAPAWKEAYRRTMLDFEPDAYGTGGGTDSGLALEALAPGQVLWPGGTLPEDAPYQYIEQEYLKEDEYDLFLDDPTDYILRYYLPRAYGALAPLSGIPPLRERFAAVPATTPIFTSPEFQQVAKALYKAGQAQAKFRLEMGNFTEEMAAIGFPAIMREGRGAGGAPFETMSSRLRGMRGVMMDMYRQPEKLLAACDKILRWQIMRAVQPGPEKAGHLNIVAGGGVLRGADGFMSKKQFEKFYWPHLKKALLITTGMGYVCNIFCEGKCDDRLEYFLELPKGSLLLRFAETDMARAKAILGGHHCIMGAVPSSLLIAGSAPEVEEYCRNLIKTCGKGGGFILRSTTDSIEHHKLENVKAMVDSVKKYGWY
jgi:hypothetical protein